MTAPRNPSRFAPAFSKSLPPSTGSSFGRPATNLDDLRQTVELLRHEIDQVRTQRNVAQTALETCQRKLQQETTEHERRLQAALRECERLRKLHAAVAHDEASLAESLARCRALEQQVATLAQAGLERRRLENLLDQTESLLQQTVTERDELLRERDSMQGEFGRWQDEQRRLAERFAAVSSQAALAERMQEQNAGLLRERAALLETLGTLTAKVEQATERAAGLHRDLEQTRQTQQAVQHDLANCRQQLDAQRQRIGELQGSLQQARGDQAALSAANELLQHAAVELAAAEDRLQSLREKVAEADTRTPRGGVFAAEQLPPPPQTISPPDTVLRADGGHVLSDLKNVFQQLRDATPRRRPAARA